MGKAGLDAVQQKVNALDTAHGGKNRVIASQAVRGAADVLQQMSTSLADRAGIDGKPTTNPAANPAVSPAVKPDAAGAALVR